ncbi:MAG: 6-hydroxymethylpterin diphosphokinase MptE-like protein, partial [Deltaproteobacteria bacterium]
DIQSRFNWVENYFENIPSYVKYPSVDILKGFKDVPMVIVGAGPSLKKNAHLLREIRGRAVIVAAVTAYKPLLKHGVIPDFVIAAEKCDLPEYFTHDGNDRQIRLILADVAHPNMFGRDAKNKFIFYNQHCDLGHKFSRTFGATYLPSCGGSVTTVAFDIGVMFGFSPIVLVGQDLAYGDDGRTHIEGGVYIDQKITINKDSSNVLVNERFLSRDHKELNQAINQKLLWLNDRDGNPIPSKFDWVTFHQWFENYIRNMKSVKFPTRLINATEGGAYIEGMEHITLREAIDGCIGPLAGGKTVEGIICEAETRRPALDMEAILSSIESMEADLNNVQRLAAGIVREAGAIKKRCASEKALTGFDREIKKIRKTEAGLFEAAGRATFLWEALSSYTYELKEYLRDDPHEDSFEQFKKDVNAIHVSYKNVGKMCRRLKPFLSKAIDAINNKGAGGKENLELSGQHGVKDTVGCV